jgi:hypothetical protein
MLSKAKGQVLRVSAALHVLINDRQEDDGIVLADVPDVISGKAIMAAQNFVQTSMQHVAYLAGKGLIDDVVKDKSTAGNAS